jgi:DNA repair ATPase RecN
MNILDTRNLAERREALKQEILDSFLENFPHYEEMTESFEDIRFEEEEIESWKEYFEDELKEIEEIDDIENEVGSEFEYGVTLVDVDDFTDYCEELVSDIGDLPKDLPSYIANNIDWEGVAEDLKLDYTEVTYQGNSYLGRG